MTTEHNPGDLVVVSLTARETVHRRGTRTLTWRAYLHEEWKTPRDITGAEFDSIDVGPGVVWETRARIALQAGTWLMRIVSQPLEETHSDPLFYLAHRSGTRRRVRKTYFVVTSAGDLRRPTPREEPPLSD